MRLDSPEMLLQEMVAELYSAETQLILALPRAAARAVNPALQSALASHLTETREHARRLEQIGELMGFACGGGRSLAMQGLLKQSEDMMGYGGDPQLTDTALISACRRIEHYEIAAYESLQALAQAAGLGDVVELVESTLEEEDKADATLESIVGQISPVPGAKS